MYYGLRFYNPELGRWLNRDPIGERGGIGLYQFIKNSPVTAIDIIGLEFYSTCSCDCEGCKFGSFALIARSVSGTQVDVGANMIYGPTKCCAIVDLQWYTCFWPRHPWRSGPTCSGDFDPDDPDRPEYRGGNPGDRLTFTAEVHYRSCEKGVWSRILVKKSETMLTFWWDHIHQRWRYLASNSRDDLIDLITPIPPERDPHNWW